MTAPFLQVRNVSLAIKHDVILQGVSFTADAGEVVGIVGRNGSGKSMLFKTIVGLVIPQTGEITVGGFPVVSERRFPPDLGALIEKPGFIGSMTALDNLSLLASIKGQIGHDEILDALRIVGLEHVSKKRVRTFSLGMKQRLGIAQAIMEKPRLLILDEPTSGLDAAGVEMLRNVVCVMKAQGAAVLVASHLPDDIEALCDRTFRIDAGCLRLVRPHMLPV